MTPAAGGSHVGATDGAVSGIALFEPNFAPPAWALCNQPAGAGDCPMRPAVDGNGCGLQCSTCRVSHARLTRSRGLGRREPQQQRGVAGRDGASPCTPPLNFTPVTSSRVTCLLASSTCKQTLATWRNTLPPTELPC